MKKSTRLNLTVVAISIVVVCLYLAFAASVSHGGERIRLRSFDGGKTFYGTGDYRGAVRSYGGNIYTGRLKSRSGDGDIRIRFYGQGMASPLNAYGYPSGSYPGRMYR